MEAAASIIGLLSVGAKIYTILEQFVSTCADAPLVAQATRDEVRDFRYALGRLEPYVKKSAQISPLGAAATDVNQLALTLASCVVTFSQLEKTLDRLLPRSQMDTIGRLRWTMAGGNLSQLVTRIQQHKSTLTLLLTIWISESSVQTEDCLERLNDILAQVMAPRQQPQSAPIPIMPFSEDSLDDENLPTPNILQSIPTVMTQESMTMGSTEGNMIIEIPSITVAGIEDTIPVEPTIDFHSVLFTSRPYKGLSKADSSAMSLSSSQRRGMQWSLFSGGSNVSVFSLPYTTAFGLSGVTLAEAPDITKIPLPVRLGKLYNQWWYPQTRIVPTTTIEGKSLSTRLGISVNGPVPHRQFIGAVKRGDMVAVLRMLYRGIYQDGTDENNGEALRIAVETGNTAMLEVLLDRGVHYDQFHHVDQLLSGLALKKIFDKAPTMLVTGLPPIGVDIMDSLSLLHVAAAAGNTSTVKLLLDRGIGVDQCTIYQNTALNYAAAHGHQSTVSLLLERGANFNVDQRDCISGYSFQKTTGYNALFFGSLNGYKGIVQLLLERGAMVDRPQRNKRLNLTALQASVLSGSKDTANLLLDKGAAIGLKSFEDVDALYLSASFGNDEMVKLLLDRGADINATQKGYLTVLEGGVDSGKVAVVRTLLDRGVSIEGTTLDAKLSLSAAKMRANNEILGLLTSRSSLL